MTSVIIIIQSIFKIYSFVVLIDVILSYFLPPYNPIKNALDKLVEPLLIPIRRILPSMGPFDFSPIVLLLGLQILEYIIVQILR